MNIIAQTVTRHSHRTPSFYTRTIVIANNIYLTGDRDV